MPRRPDYANKWRVKTRSVKVADSGPGPLRLAIRAVDTYAPLYKKADFREMLQAAMRDAGARWIEVFLIGRFQPYAAKYLGYDRNYNKHNTKRAKFQPGDGDVLRSGHPLVDTGELGALALATARTKVIGATGKNPRIQIAFRLAHQLRPKDKAVLQRIPAHEIKAIAKRVERNLLRMVAGSRSTTVRGKRRLTPSTEL